MRPIIVLMIMGDHDKAIDNQCAFRNGVGGGVAMEVLRGFVIG